MSAKIYAAELRLDASWYCLSQQVRARPSGLSDPVDPAAREKIRTRRGGSPNPFELVPEKPRGMHQRIYLRFRARAEAAAFLGAGSWTRFLVRPIMRA